LGECRAPGDRLRSCSPEVDPARIVLSGWSFSGFLAPRAAAFEKRIAALIADPGQWDQDAALKMLPVSQKALNNLDHADPAAFAPFEQFLCSPEADPMLRWRLIQRLFGVHGKSNLYDLVKDITRFEISSVPQNINCSHIAPAAEGDPAGKGAQAVHS
jgi:hypothetical protein